MFERLHSEFLHTSDPVAIEYIDGASGSGTTARRNATAWQHWSIVPRVFRGLELADSTLEWGDQRWSAPILAAPWGNQTVVHQEGEVASALGCANAGVGFCHSSSGSRSMAEIGAIGPFLQQIYVPDRRDAVREFLDRSVQSGAWAIALTVDAPPSSDDAPFRRRMRERFDLTHPDWPADPPTSARDLGTDDIGWLGARTGLPVLVKGVVHPDDARAAVDAGAAGLIVSNHGGRQIDGGWSTAQALPDVVAAVGGTVPIVVDGGIRSAEDIFRALALGANAVMLGRPLAWALAVAGAEGVERLLIETVGLLRSLMTAAGAGKLEAIDSEMVRWSPLV